MEPATRGGSPSTPTVLLASSPPMNKFAAVAGSPLDGRATVVTARTDAEFAAALPEAEAVVASPWNRRIPEFTDEQWARASRLRVIAGTFDNRFAGWLDVPGAARRGVTVIDTSRSMSPTVAEFGLAMTLSVLRDIPAAVQRVRSGGWSTEQPWDRPDFVDGELTGRRVGLAGFGAVNRRYAELLAPFRCDVAAFDPFATLPDGIAATGSLEELAARSEILVVGIPPTPATLGAIGAAVIDALPRGAALILLTRMAVVDQAALWRRAEGGEILAAVDVFEPEPPPSGASFRTSPYVMPTPHIAGYTTAAHRRCFTTACEDALAVLAGGEPRYRVSVQDDRVYRGTA